MPRMFPVTLDLRNKRCLVVGGGPVGLRKVHNLMACGARIHVVCPDPGPELRELAQAGTIRLTERNFADGDVARNCLVFAATNDEVVNQRIYDLCQQTGVLVNVVDEPERCSFFVPSVLRRGALSVAVSTEGASPLLARRLRQDLEHAIGSEYEAYIELLGEVRGVVKNTFPDEATRKRLFEAILAIDVLPLLKSGNRDEAKERILKCIYSWPE